MFGQKVVVRLERSLMSDKEHQRKGDYRTFLFVFLFVSFSNIIRAEFFELIVLNRRSGIIYQRE